MFDFRADRPRSDAPALAPNNAVLVFDGVFLLRPELFASWDLRIFLHVGFDEILRRAVDRDTALFGSPEEVERRYRTRYIPGQEVYFAIARPGATADLVVDNSDFATPVLYRLPVRSNRH